MVLAVGDGSRGFVIRIVDNDALVILRVPGGSREQCPDLGIGQLDGPGFCVDGDRHHVIVPTASAGIVTAM